MLLRVVCFTYAYEYCGLSLVARLKTNSCGILLEYK
jgi:hypothetical protein